MPKSPDTNYMEQDMKMNGDAFQSKEISQRKLDAWSIC